MLNNINNTININNNVFSFNFILLLINNNKFI